MGSLAPSFRRAAFELTLDETDSTKDTIRSLPDLILYNALHNPQAIFSAQAKQPSQPGGKIEFFNVSFLELALSVERCCAWILSSIDGAHAAHIDSNGRVQKSKAVALLMESDLTLLIYLAALLTLNVPCLLLSIRLSPQAARHLLDETGCESIIVSSRTRSSFQDILAEIGTSKAMIDATDAMAFDHFLPRRRDECLAHSRFRDCKNVVRENDRNVLILHSSGTTGLPKAIPLTHRYLLGYAGCHEFPLDHDMSQRGYNLSTLPLFHGFGVLAPSLALSVGMPVLLPPSATIPNSSLVVALLESGKGCVTSAMTVPTIAEELTLLPNFESQVAPLLAALDFVAVGGGGLKTQVGLKLHEHGVALLNHFGATELGALAPIFQPDKCYDWAYLRLRNDLNLKLEVVESKDDRAHICKLIGYPFGWDTPFELQDCLEVNPLQKRSEVKILGRNDDLIVLATGEKVLPYALERSLESHPLIKRAVVFGNGQFEVGVLLEPFPGTDGRKNAFLESAWEQLQIANATVDSHARVSTRNAILVKPDEKQIPLTDKGSVQRKQVYAMFDAEINAVYSQLLQNNHDALAAPFDLENPAIIVRQLAQQCLPSHTETGTWSDDSDFIAMGMDSLQATKFRRALYASLRNSGQAACAKNELPRDIVYSHPSVSALTVAITKWLDGSISKINATEQMAHLVDKYAYRGDRLVPANKQSVVLLTGTTGNLGANLLCLLSCNPQVHRIVCMIRPSPWLDPLLAPADLINRQQRALESRGIILAADAWLKIELLPWIPGQHHLGLGEVDYQRLTSRVTHIFHGAWPMDFNMKLQSLEPHIRAVRDLIELGCFAHDLRPLLKPRIVLASSIAVVGRYAMGSNSPLVPEISIDDPHVALPIGYAEAKWVCEKIMERAFHNAKDVEPTILRIGQLSGSQMKGFWSHKEHIPTLVKASQAIGAFPNLQGSLSWIPVDRAARVAMDILIGPGPRELVYHLENPVRQSWPDMCTVLERNLSMKTSSRLPFKDWLTRFSETKEASQELMEFFEHYFLQMSSGSLILDTTATRNISYALASTGDVDLSTIGKYVEYWTSIGFLT